MSQTSQTSFGKLLRGFRQRIGMGLLELANRLGVHRNTLVRWEAGTALPRVDFVLHIARVLHLSDDETQALLAANAEVRQDIHTDRADPPLIRSDIEQLLLEIEGSERLHLEGRNLQDINLSGMDLHRARFQGANLQGAVLTGTNLQSAHLIGTNLRKADLQGANLQDADLQRADLWSANLQSTNLQRANLQSADLHNIKLQVANLQDTNLQGADLQGADLQGANLQDADLQRTNLQGADLQGADLQRANLQRSDLLSANARDANLQGADLQRTSLLFTNLQRTNLQSANLQSATLQSANLQGAELWGANLRGADLRGANLQGRDLRGTNLQDTDLQFTNLQDTSLPELLQIRLVGEPLFAWKVGRMMMVLTELSTMCWLIAQHRFADLFTYTQVHETRLTEEAQVEIVRISKNSPMNMDWKVDLSAPSVAEALRTAIDGVTQARQRLKQMELDTQEKAHQVKQTEQQTAHEQAMNTLEEEQRRLEVEKQRLEVLEQRLDLQKRGIEDALAIAEKMVVLLYPDAQEEMKPLLVRTLLTPILQLSEIPGLELLPSVSQEKPSTGKEADHE